MSNELEKEIDESVSNEKFFLIYKKFKVIIVFFLLFAIFSPIIYFSHNLYLKNKYANELEEYSVAINNLNKKNFSESKKIFTKLLNSNNSNIAVLSLNQLISLNLNPGNEIQESINFLLNSGKLSKKNNQLVKFKNAILLFDVIGIEEIISLVGPKNNYFFLKKVNSILLNDFYISRNLSNQLDIK